MQLFNGPINGKEIYAKRRQKLLSKLESGVALLPANPEMLRNPDVHYDYRQDSSLFYLTGFPEPESFAVLNPAGKNKCILFVRQKDALRELWDGFRYGVEGAQKMFGVDAVYPIEELRKTLPTLIREAETLYYRLGKNKWADSLVLDGLEDVRRLKGRTGRGLQTIQDIEPLVGELRLFKSKEELQDLKKACEISAEGHLAAMRTARPGVYEYEVQSAIENEFKRRGSERLGYNSIVGRGPNATVLHYIHNQDICREGDLMLVDAGAEYHYLTGDITRCFPVGGRFTAAQAKLYSVVLKVQKSCIKMVKPGIKYHSIHDHAVEMLTEGMLELGLLKGSLKTAIQKRDYSKYYPHGTGHWLGMDVHDSGLYYMKDESRRLEPGMCFTIEPGLYVPANDKNAPKDLRGIGIRIEDNIHVTPKGCENLTTRAPKEIDEIEAVCLAGRA